MAWGKRIFLCYLNLVLFTTIVSGQSTWDSLQPFMTPAGPGAANRFFRPPAADMAQIGADLCPDSDACARKLRALTMDRRTFMLFQKRFTQTLDDRRTDKQVAGGNAAAGSSDAVATPGLTDLIAFAVSSGAVTQTVSQNMVTLSANGDGFYRFLAGQDPACLHSSLTAPDTAGNGVLTGCDPPSWAKNVALSASFNASTGGSQVITGQSVADGTTQSALVNVTRKNFSSATAKYAFVNNKAPGSQQTMVKFSQFQNNFFNLIGPSARLFAYLKGLLDRPALAPLAETSGCAGLEHGEAQTVFLVWRCRAANQLRTAASTEKRGVLMEQIQELFAQFRSMDPLFDVKVRQLTEESVKYIAANAVTASDQPSGPMLTADYTFSKPTLEPELHNFTFIFAYTPEATGNTTPGTFTGNLGFSLYAKSQPSDTKGNTATFRNAQAAVQFDRAWTVNQTSLQVSLAGYFQYQVNQGLIVIPAGSTIPGTNIMVPGDASMLLAPKGLISVAQAKVTIHVPKCSTPIPLGFSWSNRTDLLKGSEVRGHIGFSFDSIALARLVNPSP